MSADHMDPWTIDNKLGSMILLSGVVAIMVISCIDTPPKDINMQLESHRFFASWTATLALAMAWCFFLEIHPPLLSAWNCVEILWSSALIASLFTSMNHYQRIMLEAKDVWGEVAGPAIVGLFFTSWVFIVFNFHLGRGQEVDELE